MTKSAPRWMPSEDIQLAREGTKRLRGYAPLRVNLFRLIGVIASLVIGTQALAQKNLLETVCPDCGRALPNISSAHVCTPQISQDCERAAQSVKQRIMARGGSYKGLTTGKVDVLLRAGHCFTIQRLAEELDREDDLDKAEERRARAQDDANKSNKRNPPTRVVGPDVPGGMGGVRARVPSPGGPAKGSKTAETVKALSDGLQQMSDAMHNWNVQASQDRQAQKQLNQPRQQNRKKDPRSGAVDLRKGADGSGDGSGLALPSAAADQLDKVDELDRQANVAYEELIGAIEQGDFGAALSARAELGRLEDELSGETVVLNRLLKMNTAAIAESLKVPVDGNGPRIGLEAPRPRDPRTVAGTSRLSDADSAWQKAKWTQGVGDGGLHDRGGMSASEAAKFWASHGTVPERVRYPDAMLQAYGKRVYKANATNLVVTEDRKMSFVESHWVWLNGVTNQWEYVRNVTPVPVPERWRNSSDAELLRGMSIGWYDALATGTSFGGLQPDGVGGAAGNQFGVVGNEFVIARGGGGWLLHPVDADLRFPVELTGAGYETQASVGGIGLIGGTKTFIGDREVPRSVWDAQPVN